MPGGIKNARRLAAVLVPAVLTLGASRASGGNVDVHINIGNPPPQVFVPAPVAPQPAAVVIEQDVPFVYSEPLGFYVAVEVPYDLFFVRNSYFLCRDGRWFRAPASHGPWVALGHRDLPPGLRKHELKRIRAYRNAVYDVYRHDPGHYRGKHFRVEKEQWKADRKAEKEHWKEVKHEEKEYRKEMKRAGKEERKAEKEERKHGKD